MLQSKIGKIRLQKEEISFIKQPMEQAFVKRQGQLKFYFCLYGLEGDFIYGFYFGLLQLHSNYPFNPPKLFFYTHNGRYDINMPICTTFTNYHPQSWSSAWNVRSLIQATISFMYSNEPSYGCRADSHDKRIQYAKKSLKQNMQNQKFKELFKQMIQQNLPMLIKRNIQIFYKPFEQRVKQIKKQLNINSNCQKFQIKQQNHSNIETNQQTLLIIQPNIQKNQKVQQPIRIQNNDIIEPNQLNHVQQIQRPLFKRPKNNIRNQSFIFRFILRFIPRNWVSGMMWLVGFGIFGFGIYSIVKKKYNL